MKKPTIKDIQKVIKELVLPFYQIERDMALPIPKRRDENSAEHSWSVAFLACALAPHIDANLDLGTVSQFATIHDLVEIFAGDTSVWDDNSIISKDEREEKALGHIATRFAHFPWIAQTIQAYERKDSDEANYVWAIDKLIAVIIRSFDQGRFYREHKISKAKYDQNMVAHRKKAYAHPGVAVYYDQIQALFDEHPEYFYQK